MRPTGRNICSRAALSPSRSIRSCGRGLACLKRTADRCRQTILPGVLKQTLRQSEYLMSRAARDPQPNSWPPVLACHAAFRLCGLLRGCSPDVETQQHQNRQCCTGRVGRYRRDAALHLSPPSFGVGLSVLVQERPDQRRPQLKAVGRTDQKMSFVAERGKQVIFGGSASFGVGLVHSPG